MDFRDVGDDVVAVVGYTKLDASVDDADVYANWLVAAGAGENGCVMVG